MKALEIVRSSRKELLPRAVGALLQAYCEAERLTSAENLLSQWLHVILSQRQELQERPGTSKRTNLSVFNDVLIQTLQDPRFELSKTAAFGPMHDTASARKFLDILTKRGNLAVTSKPNVADRNQVNVCTSNILDIADITAWTVFPDLTAWASVAKMYSSRHAHEECMLVLDICIAGTANTSLGTSAQMQSIYDSTFEVLCATMQFRRALELQRNMRKLGLQATSDLKQLRGLLRYVSELETVDDKLLRLLAEATIAIAQRGGTSDDERLSLCHSLVTVLCRHGQANIVAQFIQESYSKGILKHETAIIAIKSLARTGFIHEAIQIFQLVLQKKTYHLKSKKLATPATLSVSMDRAYHDICKALRNDPERLAQLAVAYQASLK